MERVLSFKASHFAKLKGWEVIIITTDQKGRSPFFNLHPHIELIDLGINYSDDNRFSSLGKIKGYLRKRRIHRKRLTDLLYTLKPDVVVSLYPSESSFIPDIKDGSMKVLETHYSRFFRLQYNRKGIIGLIDRLRTLQDYHIVKRFDRFVVLTRQDASQWKGLDKLIVMPNPAIMNSIDKSDTMNKSDIINKSDTSRHRIIAVGRLDYQKGFDRLIEVWKTLSDHNALGDWKLEIFGKGEWYGMLQSRIHEYGLEHSVSILSPVHDIESEYAASSVLVMTSHYEGFPMVLLEAMSAGLPVVSFDCPCGPAEIIKDGENGYLVPDGDIKGFASRLRQLMENGRLRKFMSRNAVNSMERFSERKIMDAWMSIFERRS